MTRLPTYEELRASARADDDVVGLVLGGSRGKRALVGSRSDYDVYLVVRERADDYRRRFPSRHGDPVEVFVLSVEEFRAHAALGSDLEWNRYTFARVEPELDKLGGEIAAITAEKGRLPRDAARRIAAEALDGYVNLLYRSASNLRAGLVLESHLDAAESIDPLVTAVFAMEERVRPYNKYLLWELEHHPLAGEGWDVRTLAPLLRGVLATGGLDEQRALFRKADARSRHYGLGEIVDGWEPDVAWLRGDE